jgi:TnpA family transposase
VPVGFLSQTQRENYGQYVGVPSPDELSRYFHLDDADLGLISHKRAEHNRLGFAVQLSTVRYLGAFLDDLLTVPMPVLQTLAAQLYMR